MKTGRESNLPAFFMLIADIPYQVAVFAFAKLMNVSVVRVANPYLVLAQCCPFSGGCFARGHNNNQEAHHVHQT